MNTHCVSAMLLGKGPCSHTAHSIVGERDVEHVIFTKCARCNDKSHLEQEHRYGGDSGGIEAGRAPGYLYTEWMTAQAGLVLFHFFVLYSP
jgi:hypothetical protein